MNRSLLVIPLIIAMMGGFCLVSAESQKFPDLSGNWTGTAVGHERVGGYNSSSEWLYLLTITEQQGRVFNGTLFLQKKTEDQIDESIGFSGAIGADMNTFYLAEYSGGYATGRIIDTDTIEYIYMVDGENGSIAIDTFSRNKD